MDAIHERTGLTEADFETLERAVQAAEKVGIYVERKDTVGGIIEKVLEKCVAEHLQQPTFVYGFPLDTSPLAKREPDNPRFTRRFEGYIFGKEVANAFSELNDPLEQRARFEQQLALRQAGDEEGAPVRRGLPAGDGVRHAPRRRAGHRHRPHGDAADGRGVDSRGHLLPADARGVG
jgi:lysyl-tRNA synthetase class 2